ncbi:hypothetical protein F5X68DRAFT_189871 [Plectosphaerella plurivora]|uniref:Uncharacterized protein n=1 Tax=Plectosphaerella plurivora TaxID=936078 RepID=A0A9P9AC95_9PEZI|nr:hypothetical protein F5X68DRAFT_189871 [Plectosphaerella plurivora]
MAILLSTPNLRAWYDESWTKRESDTTIFWQAVFNEHFPAGQYLFAIQVPSVSSEKRANGALFRRVVGQPRQIVMLWLEAKHAHEVAEAVDEEVLDAATLYFNGLLDDDTTDEVFVMSAIGPTFRLWLVKKDASLEPFHGNAKQNDKPQYLDAKTEAASTVFFDMVPTVLGKE